jgi:putative flippase GtrA
MGATVRRVGKEAVTFSAVNVVATVVAIVLFNLLAHGIAGVYRPGPLNGWPLTAWFLANCVGMGISFYGSRRYAFKHRRPSGPYGGALNFALVNLASFTIPMACLWITRNVIGWDSALADNVSANVVGAFLGMLFRFWAFRKFVFKKRHVPGLHVFGSVVPAGRPEVGPDEPELVEHQAQQGQADPHDVVRVTGHAGHERAPQPVDGEGAGHP